MNKSPYKRSEIIFVKDDSGHDYCIHQDEEENFNRWLELGEQYWNDQSVLDQFATQSDWFEHSGYTGKDYEPEMIGCAPNYYLKTTEFEPE